MVSNNTSSSSTVNRNISIFFGLMFSIFCAYFLYWSIGYTNNNFPVLLTASVALGLFMAFNIGGNDVANSFGTSVGAKTLTITQALVIAAIFEVSGAVLAGGEVINTIKSNIVNFKSLNLDASKLILVMLSALTAAGFWLLFATKKGLPVSTTHSIIGGIIGAALFLGITSEHIENSLDLLNWKTITNIVISWFISPVLGGLVSYIIYSIIKKNILNYNDEVAIKLSLIKKEKKKLKQHSKNLFESLNEVQKVAYTGKIQRDLDAMADEEDFDINDLESEYYKEIYKLEEKKKEVNAYFALKTWVPLIGALGGMVLTAMLVFKGLKNLELGLTTLNNFLIMAMVGASIWMTIFIYTKNLKNKSLEKSTFILFSWMQVFTAAGFAFSHGSNDIANAVGPFLAILEMLRTGLVPSGSSPVPTIVMITFGVALISGLWFIGKEVIQTVGTNLTKIHPASGFAAELAAACVVMMASLMGLPVSSTHILVGAVLGIGLVNRSANWGLMKPIFAAWVITVPISALFAAGAYYLFSNIF